jgi:hypothetical protein
MAAKVIRLPDKIAIQLHLVAESCIICSSRFRRPVRKLLDTPSCMKKCIILLRGEELHVKLVITVNGHIGCFGTLYNRLKKIFSFHSF